MREELRNMIDEIFKVPDNEGTSKVCDLKEAIKNIVKPGMSLHFPLTNQRTPTAIVMELARQFWDKKGDFTISTLAGNYPTHFLVHRGLVKKLITGATGEPYFTPRPNRIFQKAIREKTMELENWSIMTLILRLKAGAMGLPFMPTNSLVGGNMEIDLKESGDFDTIQEPFGSGRKIGVVKALNPDLTLTHGWVADRYGNTICLPPWGDGVYGALASKGGVLVTVEKIVSTDFIRRYPHLVRIPGHMVRSVTEVPLGAHPSGMSCYGIPDFEGYSEDFEFFDSFNKLSKDDEKLEEWIQEWLFDCKDHWDYLKKLGYERILKLRAESQGDFWRYKIEDLADDIDMDKEASPAERAAIILTRKLKERAIANGSRILLGGAGQSLPAAFMALYQLKKEKHDIDLIIEMGMLGMLPRPANPFLISPAHFSTAKILTDSETMLGIYMGGQNNKTLAALAIAEIDKRGDINSTRVVYKGRDIPLIGSGGANDICNTAEEVIAVTGAQGADRLLDKVSYNTSPGHRVKFLVTDLGVFKKNDDDEFVLDEYYPLLPTPEENIANIKEKCGWELKVSPDIKKIALLTAEEVKILRLIDAPGVYFS